MAEPWIDAIVADLRRRYAAQARQAREAAERQAVLERVARLFWSDMADHVRTAVGSMRDALQGEDTAGDWTIDVPGGPHPMRFATSAYPAVACTVTPDFALGTVEILLRVGETPEGREIRIPGTFSLTPDDDPVLQLNGQSYTNPALAARWLVERAFRAP
jgi:hypothetical protein